MDTNSFTHYLVNPGDDYMEIREDSFIAIFDYIPERDDIRAAADNPQAITLGVAELLDAESQAPTISGLAAGHGVDVDALIKKHADYLQKIYDDKTAGDYTFVGALVMLLRELEGR